MKTDQLVIMLSTFSAPWCASLTIHRQDLPEYVWNLTEKAASAAPLRFLPSCVSLLVIFVQDNFSLNAIVGLLKQNNFYSKLYKICFGTYYFLQSASGAGKRRITPRPTASSPGCSRRNRRSLKSTTTFYQPKATLGTDLRSTLSNISNSDLNNVSLTPHQRTDGNLTHSQQQQHNQTNFQANSSRNAIADQAVFGLFCFDKIDISPKKNMGCPVA